MVSKVWWFKLYENSWLHEPDLDDIVLCSWDKASDGCLLHKLSLCGDHLLQWGRKLRSKFRDEIDICKRCLDILRPQFDDELV